jgi:hypothetical protein
MEASQFVTECQNRGIVLSLSPCGTKVRFEGEVIPKNFIPYLSKRKPEIVEILRAKGTNLVRGKPSQSMDALATERPVEVGLGEKVSIVSPEPTEPSDNLRKPQILEKIHGDILDPFSLPDDFGTFTNKRTGESLTVSGVWWLIETNQDPTLEKWEWVRFFDWLKQANARLGYSD